jgi:hypothetical protein
MTTDATKTSPADRFYLAPTVTPLAPIDIKPLVDLLEKELQRLRDQLFVEQSAARSAREALVACEERCRMLTSQNELGRLALEHAKRAEPMSSLTPGSPAAVIEAYRLLCGHEPYHDGGTEWFDDESESLPAGGHMYDQALQLLCWLDKHASGGRS